MIEIFFLNRKPDFSHLKCASNYNPKSFRFSTELRMIKEDI